MSEIVRSTSRDASEFDSSFEPLLGSDEAAPLLKIHPKPDRQPTFATAAKGEFEPLLDSESSKIKSDRTAVLALPDDAILTLSEVAAWLKLHPKTVSQMAR